MSDAVAENWADEATCERVAVVARTWLGTPFRWRAAVRRGGVDCVTFLGETFLEAGLVDSYKFPRYSLDHHKHQKRSILREFLDAHPRFGLLSAGTPRRVGDIPCFLGGQCEHHAGVMLNAVEFIHAIYPQGVVVGRLDDATFTQEYPCTCAYRPLQTPRVR